MVQQQNIVAGNYQDRVMLSAGSSEQIEEMDRSFVNLD
jgi:hypothetical protein